MGRGFASPPRALVRDPLVTLVGKLASAVRHQILGTVFGTRIKSSAWLTTGLHNTPGSARVLCLILFCFCFVY